MIIRKHGYYYITICTNNRMKLLSKIIIKNNTNVGAHCNVPEKDIKECIKIKLLPIGERIKNAIMQTNIIRENIQIDDYIIMPDHIHMVIKIIETGTLQCAPTKEEYKKSTSNSIPTIIKQIKGVVTRECNQEYSRNFKLWQRGYYEHIIRTEKEYLEICKYMMENPIRFFYKQIIYYRSGSDLNQKENNTII